jgi:diguanylate cyclase (GGDEF)-like protein
MHELLALQIRKHLVSEGSLTPELRALLAEVDKHYEETEKNRRKLEFSLSFQKKELAGAMLQASHDHALLRGVMDIIPDVLFFKSSDGSYLGFNKVYEKVLNRPASQLLGKTDFDVLDQTVAQDVFALDQSVMDSGTDRVIERWFHRGDEKNQVCLEIVHTPFCGSDGQVVGLIGYGRNITPHKLAEEKLLQQANFDSLTGLANRSSFIQRLHHEMRVAKRSGMAVALLLVNLDRFKQVNDLQGRELGDMLLTQAGARISALVRETDSVARLSADEFSVLLPAIEKLDHIGNVAQKLLSQLAEPFVLGQESFQITASIGVALYPVDGHDPETLLKNAEQAMYYAKTSGRNRYCHFTPALHEATNRRRQLLRDLPHVIDAGQLYVCYQPIVNLVTGQIHKAEALVRWCHPELGNISPADFIPLAEETGAIMAIGNYVFQEAALLTQQMRAAGYSQFQISVNMSPAQFRDNADLINQWMSFLTSLELSADAVAIEITEGMLMQVKESTKLRLDEMRNFGIKISLDDFGTGYSSLSYLKTLDIDYLKIDQSFVRDLEIDPDDRALCEAMIVMAHKLGLKVIAEGIETPGQLELLVNSGCDYGQGYLFAKPAPAVEFTDFMVHTTGTVQSYLGHVV